MTGMTTTGTMLDVLAPWRLDGTLDASDVHLAEALCRLTGEHRDTVALAAALAARAPRFGHVAVDLAAGDDPAVVAATLEAVAASPLVASDPPDGSDPASHGGSAPLVLDGSRLYLQRYHSYERSVAQRLVELAAAPVPTLDREHVRRAQQLAATLLTGGGSEHQRAAVASALTQRLTVLVGGPGTGKTTTVAAALAALLTAEPSTRIALAAPTGKAAARLGEALGDAATRLPDDVAEALRSVPATTIHRMLGMSHDGSGARLRHHPGNPLPHDVVIIDETSMVSISLMARLLAALGPDTRLLLVGDADQLVSVEAGSVLGDIAGPVLSQTPRLGPLAGHVIALTTSRRFPVGSSIDRLATAIRSGDADAAIEVLRAGDPDEGRLLWYEQAADTPAARAAVLGLAQPAADALVEAALAGDAAGAIAELDRFRLLCAHRAGPFGVAPWNRAVESSLADAGRSVLGWYPGRPVLVTTNDPVNDLYNGDLGVVVAHVADGDPSGVRVAFPGTGGPRLLPPSRLQTGDTVHAMTIHKSQGSEFDRVAVVLPPADSPLASRELVYTAITRARHHVTVVGDETAVRAAIGRRVERVGGLRDALWP